MWCSCLFPLHLYLCLIMVWRVCWGFWFECGHVVSSGGFHYNWYVDGGHSWQSLAVDIVDWLLVLLSESESVLVLCDVGEEDGLKTVDVCVDGDAVSWGICVSCSGAVCRVLFIATRCASSWSMHSSAGKNGPEMRLEWVLEGLGKGLQRGVDGLL